MPEPYYADADVTLWHGDCLDVLRTLHDASVDAVVCDPPYNLSDSGKRDTNCLRRILGQIDLPHDNDGNAERGESGHLTVPSVSGAPLRREPRPVREDAWVRVPEGAVDLDGSTIGEQEVDSSNVAPALAANTCLAGVAQAENVEFPRHYILAPADGGDTPFCDGTCGCFAEPSPGVIAVLVALPGAASRDLSGNLLGARWRGNAHVGSLNDPSGERECPPLVVTGARAVRSAVLRLDLLGRTGQLVTADSADYGNLPFFCLRTLPVGAVTGAGGLSAMSEPVQVGIVGDTTHRTFALHIPSHSLNSTRQTRGFMGKGWDGWESPAAFQRWCLAWAREVLRVLKPGGHLLAFGGTRTVHRMTCAIEDAGFEIRDGIDWIYASGFPKGQDIGKSIDRRRGDGDAIRRVTAFVADARRQAGISHKTIDDAFGTVRMANHWMTQGKAASVPTPEQWERLRALLGFGVEMDEEVARLNGRKGSIGENFAAREVTGSRHAGLGSGRSSVFLRGAAGVDERGHVAVTAAASEAAKQWEGWNTTLKPAREPIVVARKSTGFNSTVANVLEYGTGAINIDACRIEGRDRTNYGLTNATRTQGGTYGTPSASADFDSSKGRWPTNVVFSHSPGCGTNCLPGCPAGDSDTRYFPVFRFEPKASSSERPSVDGIAHETVKPLDLMRWLVRLVTPAGGLVLDPFAGSGTTAEACVIEGFRCIAIEQDAKYLPLITSRLVKPLQPTLDMFGLGEVGA